MIRHLMASQEGDGSGDANLVDFDAIFDQLGDEGLANQQEAYG